jgi:membrane protease YdiL (CAAX protease family)
MDGVRTYVTFKSAAFNTDRIMFPLRQIVLIATPPVLLATAYLAYGGLARRVGPKRGYLAGFLFYWMVWCLLLSWWALGIGGFARVFRNVSPRFGSAMWLGPLLLLIPLMLGYGYAFPRAIKGAGWKIILLSALIALVNGMLEELLWRGAYISIFPHNWLLAYLYPAIGFAVWHFAPQSIVPSSAPGGNLVLVIVAGLVGLMWGWVALQTGSILWTTISHILFDFSGLGARVYFRPLSP